MTEQEKDVQAARCAAGHNAIRLIYEFGVAEGGDLLKAVAMTYLRALAAVNGWPETLRLVREQCEGQYVPQRGAKLQLVVSAEIVKGSHNAGNATASLRDSAAADESAECGEGQADQSELAPP